MAVSTLVMLAVLAVQGVLGEAGPLHQLELVKNELNVDFSVDYEQSKINFIIKYNKRYNKDFWLAFGFSDDGNLPNGDLCLLWRDELGRLHFDDGNTDELGVFRMDVNNDCENVDVNESHQGLIIEFSRKFDTCDKEDYVIEDGTTHVIWSMGQGSFNSPDQRVDLNQGDHGFLRTRLLRVDNLPALKSSSALEITHNLMVPSDSTTYWCSLHRLPDTIAAREHHIVQYEPKWTKGSEHLLHHMEVFQCVMDEDAKLPLWQGPCGAAGAPKQLENCKQVLAAWAIGAEKFVYPREAGLKIGGKRSNAYVLLEVHFNNEREERNVFDASGLRLHLTSHLRKHDAGIMELGLIYGPLMAIPPGIKDFPLRGYCPSSCTQVLPKRGIVVFGSQLHTHATGVRVATRIFRGGRELEELNRDDHYSTHFQEIRNLHRRVHIKPGDDLVTECYYDTRSRSNVTLGGYGFEDEMCVNYIHYYPRTELEVCKSAVDQQLLQAYFNYELGPRKVSRISDDTAEEYRELDFTRFNKAQQLLDFYNSANMELQCQRGNGHSLVRQNTNVALPNMEQTLIRVDECEANFRKKRIGASFNEMKRKRVGTSFNEMKKRNTNSMSNQLSHSLTPEEMSRMSHRLSLMQKLLRENFGVDFDQAMDALEQDTQRELDRKKQREEGNDETKEYNDQSSMEDYDDDYYYAPMRLTRKRTSTKRAESKKKRPKIDVTYNQVDPRGQGRLWDRRRRTRRDPPAALKFQLDSALAALASGPNRPGAMHLVRLAKRDDNDDNVDNVDYAEDYEDLLNASDTQWADYSAWGLDKRGLGSIV